MSDERSGESELTDNGLTQAVFDVAAKAAEDMLAPLVLRLCHKHDAMEREHAKRLSRIERYIEIRSPGFLSEPHAEPAAPAPSLVQACEDLLRAFDPPSKLSDSLIRAETDAIRVALVSARTAPAPAGESLDSDGLYPDWPIVACGRLLASENELLQKARSQPGAAVAEGVMCNETLSAAASALKEQMHKWHDTALTASGRDRERAFHWQEGFQAAASVVEELIGTPLPPGGPTP